MATTLGWSGNKLVRVGAVGLLMLGLGGMVAGCGEPQAEPAPEIRPVRTTKVHFDSGVIRQTYAGAVAPRYETAMSFRVAGKIAERLVDVGQTVKKGQVLARLDPEDLKLQLRATQAQLRSADADLARSKADFDRYEQLKTSVAYNPSVYEQRLATYRAAVARVEQLKEQLRLADNQLGYTDLVAPANGVVTQLTGEAGQVVGAGQTVMVLNRTDELEVVVAVPESRLAEVRAVPTASASLWSSDRAPIAVTLREIAPSADPATRTYRVRYSIPAGAGDVQLGMSATVTVTLPGGETLASLPLTAIYQEQGKPAVWVVDVATGKLVLKPITVSSYRQSAVMVAQGVNEGDLVVTAGVHKLDAAMRVRLMTEARS
jgi:RND family efflux transporter MFP subunit